MPTIHVTKQSGEEVEVQASTGESLMEALRDAGVEELLAICGGCLSCATCHIYVDESAGVQFPEKTADESMLLESSEYLKPNSRLSCQIPVTDDMEGLKIEVAPEE